MADLTPSLRRAMQYFGVIEGATRNRQSTSDIWAAIRAQAQASGLDAPGVTAQDVSRLRGMAGGIRSASQQLAATDPAFGLTAELIASAPWARPLAEQNTLPMYQVRFLHTTNVNGQDEANWRSIMLRGALPPTVGDLTDLIGNDAQQLAETYNSSHVAVSDVSILAV